jgi:TRAP-type C4-dicarboxylate transport system permease small subunit
MVILSADAVLRYLVHEPLQWAFDVVSAYLMVAAPYFALAETFRRGDHICIGVLRAMMPRRWKVVAGVVGALPAIVVFSIIAYGGAVNAIDSYRDREFLPGYLAWAMWPSYLPIALGAALLVLRLAHHTAMLLREHEDPYVQLDAGHVE